MKLIHKDIDKIFDFSGEFINHLIIENPSEFYRLTCQLYNQCMLSEEGDWVLSNKGILDLQKSALLLYDYFNIDFSGKKIQNLIDSEILNILKSNDIIKDFSAINTSLTNINLKVQEKIDLPIEYKYEFNYEDFIKFSKFSINTGASILEKIISYIDIFIKLKNISLVIFINLSLFFSDEQIQELIKQLNYFDIKVFIIDSYARLKIENENLTILDNDLCVI